MKLSLTKPLAFIDLETTGLDIVNDRIIEIAILKLLPDGNKELFIQRINPGIPVPPKTTAIHGIKDDDLIDKPTFDKVGKNIVNFIDNADLAGFNIMKFDLPLLVEEFLRFHINFSLENRKVIDVQHIFHKMEKRDLATAYKFYCEKTIEKHHSAEYDIRATEEILHVQLEKYKNIGNNVDEINNFLGKPIEKIVDFASRMIIDDRGDIVYNFGKYKGKRVDEIFEKDPSYYSWIMNSDFSQNTKNKLTELYMKWKRK